LIRCGIVLPRSRPAASGFARFSLAPIETYGTTGFAQNALAEPFRNQSGNASSHHVA
jgi:hypothetical protein